MTWRLTSVLPLLWLAACCGPAYRSGISIDDADTLAALRRCATLTPPACTLRHRVHIESRGAELSTTTITRVNADGSMNIVGLGDFGETLFQGVRQPSGTIHAVNRGHRFPRRLLRCALVADFHALFAHRPQAGATLEQRPNGDLAVIDKQPRGRLGITLFRPDAQVPHAWLRIRYLRCIWRADMQGDTIVETPIGPIPQTIRTVNHAAGYTSTLQLISAHPAADAKDEG